jgi:hypothetical protein
VTNLTMTRQPGIVALCFRLFYNLYRTGTLLLPQRRNLHKVFEYLLEQMVERTFSYHKILFEICMNKLKIAEKSLGSINQSQGQ